MSELPTIPTELRASAKTEVGSYFVANYPPFSVWNQADLEALHQRLHGPPSVAPLGMYVHIPFCRKRCKFCYFRVYTDKRADEIEVYLQALIRELELVGGLSSVAGRKVRFVYFGGGTPSFLSVRQLHGLADRLREIFPWSQAEEVTFECEPGTLSESKVRAIRDLGVTRLSLGIENFSDSILEENGRAHLSQEISRSWDWICKAGFPSVNVDLIAGMVGETWDNWRDCIRKTIALAPDSVTIYQMELPFNTVYSKDLLQSPREAPIADWPTKRAWVSHAIDELGAAGYRTSSAYTLVRRDRPVAFRYRDELWEGSDLLAVGIASFGHLAGVHYQNESDWQPYVTALDEGRLPLARAFEMSAREQLIRELILQLKRGSVRRDYFAAKFGVDIKQAWSEVWAGLEDEGMLDGTGEGDPRLSRQGLLCVDSLLPRFFDEKYRGVRYT